MSEELPEVFAVIRTQAYRGPGFQFMKAQSIREGNNWLAFRPQNQYYIVRNYDISSAVDTNMLQRISPNNLDRNVYKIRYKHHEDLYGQTHETYFWFMPFYFIVGSEGQPTIPVIEFQYRSWLPMYENLLPLDRQLDDFVNIMERIQGERISWIHSNEDRNARSANPRNILRDHIPGPDDYDSRVMEPGPFVGVMASQTQRARVTTPRTQTLPKHVGDVLLANARKGSDSCPIAALPYAECSKLSVSSCFHIFDSESLAKWQEQHNTCPVCRTTIVNIVSE